MESESSVTCSDPTYEFESLDCGQYVLDELSGLYKYFYKNGQDHGGLPQLHRDHLRFQPLFKKGSAGDTFRRHTGVRMTDRQSLGTPGLLKPSHYILPHGKVNLHESPYFCVFT